MDVRHVIDFSSPLSDRHREGSPQLSRSAMGASGCILSAAPPPLNYLAWNGKRTVARRNNVAWKPDRRAAAPRE